MATATHPTNSVRPDRTKLYGLTHDIDGTPLRRKVRSLKCGIGVPKGPDIHVWIEANGEWCIGYASWENGKRNAQRKMFKSRDEAERAYTEMRAKVSERKYPAKLPYFTFLRPTGDGGFIHDFEAIELHGPVPTELDIFFTNEDVFAPAYEWWASSKLKCWGNGKNALRRKELAKTAEEIEAAQSSPEKDFFPIIGGCYMSGCHYAYGEERVCKPHGRLTFQLMQIPSIGAVCTFDTTSFRSTAQISSSLTDILEITGRGDADKGHVAGIPLRLTLAPYTAYPNGKPTKLYAANVVFRPQSGSDAAQIANAMIQHTYVYHAPQPLMIEAPVADVEDEAVIAAEMEAEFYPENQDHADQGSDEAREQVRVEKLADLKKRGAKVTEIRNEPQAPQKAAEQTPDPAKAEPQAIPVLESEPGEDEPQYEAGDEDLPTELGGTSGDALPKYLDCIEQFRSKLGEERFAWVLKQHEYNDIRQVRIQQVTVVLAAMVEAGKSLPPQKSKAAETQVVDPGKRPARLKF